MASLYIIPSQCSEQQKKYIWRTAYTDYEKESKNSKCDFHLIIQKKHKNRTDKQNRTLWVHYEEEWRKFCIYCTGEPHTKEQGHELLKGIDEIYSPDWEHKSIFRFQTWNSRFILNLRLFNTMYGVLPVAFFVSNQYKIRIFKRRSTTWLSTEQFNQLIENMIKFCANYGYEIKPHDWYEKEQENKQYEEMINEQN